MDMEDLRAKNLARASWDWLEQRNVPSTPQNFAIAYAYAEGENIELKRCVDALSAVRSAFDASVMMSLHKKLIQTSAPDKIAVDLTQNVAAEIDTVLQLLASAGRDQATYKEALSSMTSGLEGSLLAQSALTTLISGVLQATRIMEARTEALEAKLQDSSREMAELRQGLDTSQRQSLTDHLTNLLNRRGFDIALQDQISRAQASGEPLSIVMFDIDHFKKFNDTWGHQVGDHVIRLVANAIAENVRADDTPTRFGGEEFVIILPGTKLKEAALWADNIRTMVCARKLIKRTTAEPLGFVSVSGGIAQYKPNDSVTSLIQRADSRLYAAKHAGRNCVVSGVVVTDEGTSASIVAA